MKQRYDTPGMEIERIAFPDPIRTSGEDGDCYLDDCFEPIFR